MNVQTMTSTVPYSKTSYDILMLIPSTLQNNNVYWAIIGNHMATEKIENVQKRSMNVFLRQ